MIKPSYHHGKKVRTRDYKVVVLNVGPRVAFGLRPVRELWKRKEKVSS